MQKIAITAFVLNFFLFLFVPVSEAKTKFYQVTEGVILPPASPPGANGLVFRENIFIENNDGGRFVISSTPDGKGDITIGDELIVSNIRAFKSYEYSATSDCQHFNSVLSPVDITHISTAGPNNFTFVIRDRCARYQEIGPIYLVHLDIPGADPFLELPWNYEEKGLSFTEAALSMSAYFDHEYPLLSSGMGENSIVINSILGFDGKKPEGRDYSSHDGYDWASVAKAEINDSVLAAGSGVATYINTCSACGNAIHIDHNNGYQTRYYHLQKDGLITDIPGNGIPVIVGQQIGKIGATGNVVPVGDKGAHIHFMVIQDKNYDGNFQDNIPDGVVDPFGWQSSNPDPWEIYTFNYAGQPRTGTRSYYLWNNALEKLETPINRNGGTFGTEKFTITFPPDSINRDASLRIVPLPRFKTGVSQESIGIALLAEVVQSSGALIKFFSPPLSLIIDFSGVDIDMFQPGSIKIYSSENGEAWTPEITVVDWENKKATAQINHMTQFALLGERRDLVPPETRAIISGTGSENIFSTNVQVSLEASDNVSGVSYIMFRKDDSDWEPYTHSLLFETEGNHWVEFYAEDEDGNIEDTKRIDFQIEKVMPELQLSCNFEADSIDIVPKDEHPSLTIHKELLENNRQKITVMNNAGRSLVMIGKTNRAVDWKAFWIESLQYDDEEIQSYKNTRLRCRDNPNRLKTQQVFVQKDTVKIKLTYIEKKDTTSIMTKIEDEKEVIHIVGVKVLKLVSEKGKLIYSY